MINPKLCWFCGKRGSYGAGTRMYCDTCDVTWMLVLVEDRKLNDRVPWNGMVIDAVDFSDPNTISSPA